MITAAIAFIHTQLTQGRKTRAQAIRAQRIAQMSKVCNDLATILQQGDEVVAKVRMAQAGRSLTVSVDDFTDFCVRVDRYIRVNAVCGFMVWATEEERLALLSLSTTVREWNNRFLAAAESRSTGGHASIPSFDELIEQLTSKVESFSTLVRQEIERTDA